MYGWQGLSYDAASGHWDNRARQYAPETGTFTSQDPLGLASGENNLYRSRGSNPVRYKDTTGKFTEEFFSEYLTPNQQMLAGTTTAALGVYLVKTGIGISSTGAGAGLGAAVCAAGIGLGYEGTLNAIEGYDRQADRIHKKIDKLFENF